MNFENIELPYLFNDRFLLKELIGAGGVGRVYLARDEYLSKDIAIKVLNTAVSEQHLMRFQKEAKAVAKLKHPNIVEIFDFGISDESCCYLTMEYIDGCSLADLLRKRKHLDLEECVEIVTQLLDGLIHAHRNELLHRDIKSSNVMLANSSSKTRVKIVDFGIAKFMEESQELTARGAPIGSPYYVSPEQAKGAGLDQRSDLYSVGCLMYEALTGVVPFEDEDVISTIKKRLEEDPPLFSEANPEIRVSKRMEELVFKCLERDPGNRFNSAQELRDALLKIELKTTADVPLSIGVEDQVEKSSKLPAVIFSLILLTCVIPIVTSPLWVESLLPKEDKLPKVFHKLDADVDDRFPEIASQGVELIKPVEQRWKIKAPALNKEAWKFISEQKSVDDLNLEQCKVDDEAFESVCRLTNLKALRIWSTVPVSPAAFENILKLKNLDSLRVQNIGLDARHMKILSNLTGLDSLDIAFNDDIKSGDLKYLKSLKKLKNFTVGNPELPVEEVVEFVNSMPNIGHFGMRMLPKDTSNFEVLRKLKRVTTVDMSKCGSIDDTILKAVAGIPSLQVLDLSRTHVKSDYLYLLNASPQLAWLYLKSNGYGDRDLFYILKLRGLDTIEITKNYEFTDPKLKIFLAQVQLKKVAKNVIVETH